MRNIKIKNTNDMFYVLDYLREYNDQTEEQRLSDMEREDHDFKIQEIIGDIEEFLFGLQTITKDALVESNIFCMQMWSYITREADKEDIVQYLEERNVELGDVSG